MTANPWIKAFGRVFCAALLSAPLVLGLAGCGKKGSPKPPEGQESEYTYPRAYPAPSTVTPDGTSQPDDGANPLSIFTGDDRRKRTKTY